MNLLALAIKCWNKKLIQSARWGLPETKDSRQEQTLRMATTYNHRRRPKSVVHAVFSNFKILFPVARSA